MFFFGPQIHAKIFNECEILRPKFLQSYLEYLSKYLIVLVIFFRIDLVNIKTDQIDGWIALLFHVVGKYFDCLICGIRSNCFNSNLIYPV